MRILLILALMVSTARLTANESSSQWQVPAVQEGTLTLHERDGVTVMDYTLTPYLPILEGHYQHLVNNVDLLLRAPVTLPKNATRIFFEASGLQLDARNLPIVQSLRPIVRDRDGELFYYMPSQNTMLAHKREAWGSYSTAGFYSGEAGAASHGIYTTGDKVINARPDGELQLLGFRMQIARSGFDKAKAKPVSGTICLGNVTLAENSVPFRLPFLYADSVLREKGTYDFNVQIANEFQGHPIREMSRRISYDPANPVSKMQQLEFPLGPDGFYWIRYQIINESGAQVADGTLQYQVAGNPDKTAPAPVNLALPPTVGKMRINQDHAGRGVYPTGDPYRIRVTVFPGKEDRQTLSYKLYPYFQADLLQAKDIAIHGTQIQELEFDLPHHKQYNVFRLEVSLKRANSVLDSQTYYFGEKTDPTAQLVRAGKLTNRHELKQQPYNRFTYLPSDRKDRRLFQYYADDFAVYLEQTQSFIQNHTYMIDLNDFSPLPGVYDFSQLDAVMDAAADYGSKVTIRLAHADSSTGPYRWGKFSHQYNAYGEEVAPGHYGVYEVTDRNINAFWLDCYRALYNRYRQHTAFQGYYIMLPAGEWVVVDQPWAGVVAGYSPVSANSFREYLQQTLKLDLLALNKRWGTAFSSFEAIVPPQPTFRDGMRPDLRLQWLDFCRFKTQLGTDFWLPNAVNSIRSYDNNNVTIVYGHPSGLQHLAGKLDYGHNGGNHTFGKRGEFVEAWSKSKIGWITEPHHPHRWAADGYSPGKDGWVLDASVWNMLAQAGGGGANLHVYYLPLPNAQGSQYMLPHYGGAFALDRFERMKPLLRELHDAQPILQFPEIAVNQDIETLYCKHRTTFNARLADLGRWKDLVEKDGLPYARMTAFPDKSFKLIVPNLLDEIISLDTLHRYEKLVKEDGGKIIISANTGKYVPELGAEPFQLLRAFDITIPTEGYQTTGEASATAKPGNPLFDDGKEVSFQTLTRLRTQLASPEVQKAFWDYEYRWIPETDYFGYYPRQKPNGSIIATFCDGGAAMSLHKVGKGEVLVFWGTPDISGNRLRGMMLRAAAWAGISTGIQEGDIAQALEMNNPSINRHYGLFYLEQQFGVFTAKFPGCPDGEFFCDELIMDHRIGLRSGKSLREEGLSLKWERGDPPLKAVRMIPAKTTSANWVNQF